MKNFLFICIFLLPLFYAATCGRAADNLPGVPVIELETKLVNGSSSLKDLQFKWQYREGQLVIPNKASCTTNPSYILSIVKVDDCEPPIGWPPQASFDCSVADQNYLQEKFNVSPVVFKSDSPVNGNSFTIKYGDLYSGVNQLAVFGKYHIAQVKCSIGSEFVAFQYYHPNLQNPQRDSRKN